MNINLIFVPEYIFTDKKDILNSLLLTLDKTVFIDKKALLNTFNSEKSVNTLSISEMRDIIDCTNYIHQYLTGNKESFFMKKSFLSTRPFINDISNIYKSYRFILDIPYFKASLLDVITGKPNNVDPSIEKLKYKKESVFDKLNNVHTFYIVNVTDPLVKYLYLNTNLDDKISLYDRILKFVKRFEPGKNIFQSDFFLEYLIRLKELNKKGLPKQNKVTIPVGD